MPRHSMPNVGDCFMRSNGPYVEYGLCIGLQVQREVPEGENVKAGWTAVIRSGFAVEARVSHDQAWNHAAWHSVADDEAEKAKDKPETEKAKGKSEARVKAA